MSTSDRKNKRGAACSANKSVTNYNFSGLVPLSGSDAKQCLRPRGSPAPAAQADARETFSSSRVAWRCSDSACLSSRMDATLSRSFDYAFVIFSPSFGAMAMSLGMAF